MTVETLIERLKKMPPKAKVKIFCSYDNYSGENVPLTKENIEYDVKTNTLYFSGVE